MSLLDKHDLYLLPKEILIEKIIPKEILGEKIDRMNPVRFNYKSFLG